MQIHGDPVHSCYDNDGQVTCGVGAMILNNGPDWRTIAVEADPGEDWTPRRDAWTVLVRVTADQEMADWRQFDQWKHTLCQVVGAVNSPAFDDHHPWVVGDRYGYWATNHFGIPYWNAHPYVNVWQRIEGLPSKAMALVWAAIHLVQPLDAAGFDVFETSAELTDTMIVMA
jgi:hypothetical protein